MCFLVLLVKQVRFFFTVHPAEGNQCRKADTALGWYISSPAWDLLVQCHPPVISLCDLWHVENRAAGRAEKSRRKVDRPMVPESGAQSTRCAAEPQDATLHPVT